MFDFIQIMRVILQINAFNITTIIKELRRFKKIASNTINDTFK